MSRGKRLIENIEEKLTLLQNRIINSNKGRNSYDLNRYAEPIYAPILGEIFETEFTVLEYKLQNTPGIDLGSEDRRIAIQVTSEGSFEKIKHTIINFLKPKYKYHEKYDKLFILFIGENYNTSKTNSDIKEFIFSLKPSEIEWAKNIVEVENFWNTYTLINKIDPLINKIKKLQNISEQLDQHFDEYCFDDRYLNLYDNKDIQSLNAEMPKGLNIEDSIIWVLDKFDGFTILPAHIISKVKPFSVDTGSYYSKFSYYTDNPDLYNYIKSLEEISEDEITDNQKRIIKFFMSNLYYHLSCTRSVKEIEGRICVHNFKYQTKKCECLKCTFNRMDYDNLFSHLYTKPDNNTDLLKQAYITYKLHDYKSSIKLFQELANSFEEDKDFIAYFICMYNLSRLRILFRNNYYGDDYDDINEELNKIDLPLIIYRLKNENKITSEIEKLLWWIENTSFINSGYWDLYNHKEKAIQLFDSDQRGGWCSNNLPDDILDSFARVVLFVEENFIVYDNFLEFSAFFHSGLESIVSSYQYKNKNSTKVTQFTNYIIMKIIKYGDFNKMRIIFKRYNVNFIEYSESHDDKENPIFEQIMNFLSSSPAIKKYIDLVDKSKHRIRKDINKRLSNIYFFLSYFSTPKSITIKIIEKSLEFFAELEHENIDYEYYKGLNLFISKRGEILPSETLEEILFFWLENRSNSDSIINSITSIFKNRKEILKNNLIINRIENYLNDDPDFERYNISTIIDLSDILDNGLKAKIEENITVKLEENFNPHLYHSALLKGVCPLREDFINEIKNRIPKAWRKDDSFSRKTNAKNELLNIFINVAFKYNIDLDKPDIQTLKNNSPYYSWLLNLGTFDYSDFEIYWLFEYQTIHYFNEFKKHKKIHLAIKESMNKDYIKGISEIYFEYFMPD